MKLIYTHHNPMLVGIVQGKLEMEGFRLALKNELVSGAAGELAPIDLWPELWLKDHQDLERAESIVSTFTQEQEHAADAWKCEECGEKNTANFEICWKCQQAPMPDRP